MGGVLTRVMGMAGWQREGTKTAQLYENKGMIRIGYSVLFIERGDD
jgi:hypothetical protein